MLAPGSRLPSFRLQDQHEAWWTPADVLGKGPFVVYFYPKDETPVCTAQACSFRDAFAEFTDHGAAVYGVSEDPPASHRAFAERHRLPFTLWSDPGGHFAAAMGLRKLLGILADRVTFVFDVDGVVRHHFQGRLAARRHVEESMTMLQALRTGRLDQ
jgi:peroxiredoxin Q/BCP